jgi:hypothetical protein
MGPSVAYLLRREIYFLRSEEKPDTAGVPTRGSVESTLPKVLQHANLSEEWKVLDSRGQTVTSTTFFFSSYESGQKINSKSRGGV